MKKLFAGLLIAGFAAASIAGCGGGGGVVSSLGPTAGLTIKLTLPSSGAAKALSPAQGGGGQTLETKQAPSADDVASVTLKLSGTNYTTVQKTVSVVDRKADITIDGLQPATGVSLELTVYSVISVPLFEAWDTIDLEPGVVTEANLTLTPTRPAAVTLSLGTYVNGSSVPLLWTASSAPYFESYQIYGAITPGVDESSVLVGEFFDSALTSGTVMGLNLSTHYYFKVFVVSESGWSTGSNEIDITTIDPDPAVVFNDSTLENAVKTALNPGDDVVNQGDCLALTVLDASSLSITDLTGLEYCTNLEDLDLSGNTGLSNLSAISGLTALTDLNLSSCNVSDLYHLGNLLALETLDLSGNQLADISVLEDLTTLHELYLSGNGSIVDISPLVDNNGPGSGDIIDLQGTALDIDDLDDIQTLAGRGVGLLHDVAGAVVVTFVDLDLEDVVRTALAKPDGDIFQAHMETLTDLDASNTGISDITGLEYAVNLQSLDLSSNQVVDLTPLTSCISLVTLDLTNNLVLDISPLVANLGIGGGDTITLTGNPLNPLDPNIAILKGPGRGVTVIGP